MKRIDCFAYKDGRCKILSQMQCDDCHFYKQAGTECDTCPHKNKPGCKGCRECSVVETE